MKFYFQTRATTKLHSELGMPNVVTMDSLKQMMREADMWPLGDVWGIHDFTRTGAQGASTWLDMIDRNYGGAKSAEEFVELSQFIDYDGYRAMFEAQGKNRMGMLLWMSHPCWPSFVWQTYDYYFDQNGGYFGSKKGSEPLHIQWNPLTESVEVVNYSGGNARGLNARVEVLNMDGSKKWEKSATLDSAEDSVQSPIKIEYPAGLTPVHFIRLNLTRGAQTVSDQFLPSRAGREPACAAARRRAWRRRPGRRRSHRVQPPGHPLAAQGQSERHHQGGAEGIPLVSDHGAGEPQQDARADGAGEGRAREEWRPHFAGPL